MSTKKYPQYQFIEIFDRIKKELSINKFIELVEIIETTQSNISKRKKENYFPPEWAFIIAEKYNLSTDWIMTGKGEKKRFLEPEKIKPKNQVIQKLDIWLSEITKKNPEKAIWFKYQLEVAFPEFRDWLKRKEKQIKDNQSQKVA